ncbi:MAG: beta strand repeat-containing protein [Actinomycetota bacterium]
MPIAALLGLALMVGGSFVATSAVYAAPEHGLAVVKGCDSPTTVGQKTKCYFGVYNNQGDPDTLTITSLSDVVASAGGNVSSGNVLSLLDLVTAGGASCGGTPFTCTLPVGGSIETNTAFEFYTVTAADVANANPLPDTVTVTWTDTCNSGAPNCPVGPQTSTTGSQTTLQKAPSSTATTILKNSDGSVVPSPFIVPAGTVVRDTATVTGTVGGPTPTGTVTFDFFTNADCTGTPDSTSSPVALSSGLADATGFTKTLSSVGGYGFLAHYSGDGYYSASDGPCEPISAVDARITITANGTNEVGDPHTFTVTLQTNDGTGWAAAAGESVTTSLTDTNGASASVNSGASTCAPPGGTLNGSGQCTIVFQSGSAGVTTGNASWTGSVGGVSFTRATNGNAGPGGSGPAVKTWVDGRIKIEPSDTNEVGNAHTFDVTVEQNAGGGSWAPAVGVTVAGSIAPGISIATITGGTCETGTTNASGVCTFTVNSSTVGTGTVNASATWSVGGVSITRATNGTSGYGSNTTATKTWVDARIKISPDATNEVGDPHTFTVTVEKNAGDGNGFVAASGVTVTPSISNTNGATATVTGGTCQSGTTNASGQCTVIINSPTTGKTTVDASASVTINGVVGSATVSRSTASTPGPGGTNGSVKTWVDASIVITPSDTSEVGGTLTFVVTVRKDLGDGNGLVPAPGVSVTGSLAQLFGATATITAGTCESSVTDASGVCFFTVTSPTTGRTVGNAAATIVVAGVSIDRDTDPDSATPQGDCTPNCGPATKTWVDANITIDPDGVNQVGDPHTFTVTVKQDAGDGNGLQPVDGATITPTLVNSGGSTAQITGGTCDSGTTNASGQCTIIVNSPTAGTATVDVSVTLTINGLVGSDTPTRATDGNAGPGGSDGATKTWINASIMIEPDATNEVSDSHTFTVTVKADQGSGLDPAAGVTVTPSISNLNGATATITGGTCESSVTDASGQCTIVISSPTSGQTVANASATVTVDGVPVTVDTDPATSACTSGPCGSGPATKTWVDANITIGPDGRNPVNAPHTFTVTVQQDRGDGNGFVPAEGAEVSFTLDDSDGASTVVDEAASTCVTTGVTDADGQCTIVFTSSTTGTTTGNAATTLSVGGVTLNRDTDPATDDPTAGPDGSGPAVKTWYDTPTTTTTTIAPVLPVTGANTSSLVLPGLAMIAAGAALLLATARSMARRRRMI